MQLFFNDTAPTEIYTLSLHDALPICLCSSWCVLARAPLFAAMVGPVHSSRDFGLERWRLSKRFKCAKFGSSLASPRPHGGPTGAK